jgi:hypothetical protein
MPSSYQVVLWKQERFLVLRPLQIEFFRNLLESKAAKTSGGLSWLRVVQVTLGAVELRGCDSKASFYGRRSASSA